MSSLDELLYKEKYLKYKNKYIQLKEYQGGERRRDGIKGIIASKKKAYIFADENIINNFYTTNNKLYINFNIIKNFFNKKGYIITSDIPKKITIIDSSNIMSDTLSYFKDKKENLKKNIDSTKKLGATLLNASVSTIIGSQLVIDNIQSISNNIEKTINNVNKTMTNFNKNEIDIQDVNEYFNKIITNEQDNIENIISISSLLYDKHNIVIPRITVNNYTANNDSSSTFTLKEIQDEIEELIFDKKTDIDKIKSIISIIKKANNIKKVNCILIEFTSSMTNKVLITRFNIIDNLNNPNK